MRRLRAWVFFTSMSVVMLAVVASRGQTAVGRALVVLEHVGLPAVDEGVVQNESHVPGSADAIRRVAIRRSLRTERLVSSGARYVPGRVIVKFRDGASTAARLSALSAASRTSSIMDRPRYADFDIVRIDRNEDPEAVARDLMTRRVVEYAQASYRMHTMFVPNDPLYRTLQWNLPLINMERAWDIQPQAGSSITVAVLDTGIAYAPATVTATAAGFIDDAGTTYPALGQITIPYSAASQLVTATTAARIVAPHDFIWDSTTPLDFDGHGTHVSGTIGQLTNDSVGTAGVAFNVKLMPVKVIESAWDLIFGAPNEGDDETVARGIRYAADNGAKVINMSIGREGPSDCGANPDAPGCPSAVESAIRYAVCTGTPSATCSGKGVFVAIAAGNGFEAGNPTEVIAEIASRVQGAVSVAAVDPAKNHAFYSSTASWVELAAPGGSSRGFGSSGAVWQQTFDFNFTDTFLLPPSQYKPPRFDVFAYVAYIGTSMATAHVSGVAAMLMQQGITDPAAVEAALEKFAVDLGSPGRDNVFGFGLIDSRSALRGLGLAR